MPSISYRSDGIEWVKFGKLAINGLDAVSGTRIKPSHIPRVMNFGKEINQTQKVDEIFDSWIKNNQALKTFIDAERGN